MSARRSAIATITTLTIVAATLAIAITLPGRAGAHGGEDHAAPATAPAAAPGADGRRVAIGQTAAVELLVKYAPPAAGQAASLMLFVSDYASNAPVDGAKVTLEVQASPAVTAVAEPTGTTGTYHAIAKVPPGTYAAIATIEATAQLELVELKDLDLTPPATPAVVAPAVARGPFGLGIGLALALGGGLLVVAVIVAIAVGLGVRARSRARRAGAGPTTLTAILLVAGLAGLGSVARGHGGEDHSAPAAAPVAPMAGLPPGAVYMAKESQFLLGVLTAVAKERDIEARVQAIGRVIPRIDGHAAIAAPVAGRIAAPPAGKLPYIGDRVKKGQALFVVEQTLGAAESGDLRARALEARSAVAQARARRDQARRELERRRSLEGVIAAKEIQEAQVGLELAERELELAEQQVGLFGGAGLTRLTVTSPIDGTIAAADVSLGEQVTAEQSLYTVLDAATLWIEAEVFEGDVARVSAAGRADVRIEGHAAALPATVYRIGQLVDPATRTVKVVLAIDNPAGLLRPGIFAQVSVGAGTPERVLAVPDAAVIEDGGRRFVFVKLGPEVFVRREVVLGGRDGDAWAVRAGVTRGERVVVAGTYQLRTMR